MAEPSLSDITAAVARHGAWLALRDEDIIDPDLPIIDPHHHLWHRNGSTYLMPQLLDDLGSGHNIIGTVYVECQSMYRPDGPEALRPVGETAFVVEQTQTLTPDQAQRFAPCAGIVSFADLSLGSAVEDVLVAHQAVAAGRLRGIRFITAWEPTGTIHTPYLTAPNWLTQPAFREGFARLAPLGLSFDAWLYHLQLAELADVADAFPDTTIVLNHIGGALGLGAYAGRRDEIFPIWQAAIQDLAQRPNVIVKLGGLGMKLPGFRFSDLDKPPSSVELAAAWRPYITTCIEAFGVARCMFESNFPVDNASCSYPVLWNAFKRLAKGATGDEKDRLFAGTARAVYRLG